MAISTKAQERAPAPAQRSKIFWRRTWREARRFAPRLWYTFSNLTRWAIIGVMFFFLLAMVVVLNEVREFQERVVTIVGDNHRARDAVMMLHRIQERPDAFPEDESLPFAALAVQLDHVFAALGQLQRFGDFRSPEDATATIEAQADGQAADGEDRAAETTNGPVVSELSGAKEALSEAAYTHFQTQRQELTDNLEDLHRRLTQAEPNIGVIEAMSRVEAAARALTAFTSEETTGGGPAEASPSDDPVVDFAHQVRALNEDLAALKQKMSLDATNRPVVDQVDPLMAAADRLYELRLRPDFAIAEGAGDGTDRTAGVKISEGGADPDAEKGKTGTELIQDIWLAAGGLDRELARAFDDRYNAAREISRHLNEMRQQVGVLEEFTPGDFDPLTDELVSSEAAKEYYAQTLGQLSESFRGLEQRLGERTRVVALANVIRAGGGEAATDAAAKAAAILNDFDALDRFLVVLMPLTLVSDGPGWPRQLGIHPQHLATLSTDSINTIYIFMIGAIGSLLYIAKYYMGMALQGHWFWHRPTRPLSWLLFRPFFGIVVAFALYLMVRAGQLAFGSNGEQGLGSDLNIPILSVVALLAGLLSWQALRTIESRGAAWFTERERRPLWATGLGNALRTEQISIAECAARMGRSIEQVERWTMFRDRVTAEMQDRLTTWLERNLDELFSDRRPADEFGGKPMWATGLKRALDERDRRLDVRGLAELLHEDDIDRVRKWVELKLQVTPTVQWQLVDILEIPHHRLFDHDYQEWSGWGIGLREAMKERNLTAYRLAQRLELADPVRLHRWKELDELVPARWQDDLVEKLDRSHGDLFEFGELAPGTMLYAHRLREAMAAQGITGEQLAQKVDVELERVGAWIRREKQVAPATRRRLATVLEMDESDLFAAQIADLPPAAGGAGGEAGEGAAAEATPPPSQPEAPPPRSEPEATPPRSEPEAAPDAEPGRVQPEAERAETKRSRRRRPRRNDEAGNEE